MPLNMEKLTKLAQLSANRSAEALTKLVGVKTAIDIVDISVAKSGQKINDWPIDSYVVGIYLPTRGDLSGSTLMLFPKKVAMRLASLLTKQKSSMHGFDEIEVSALKETGNIICGNFFSVVSNELHMRVIGHLPLFVFDTFSSVMNQLQISNVKPQEVELFIEIRINIQQVDIVGYIIIAIELLEVGLLSESLEKIK